MSGPPRAMTYAEYLRLRELLSCQEPPDGRAPPGPDGRRPARALLHPDELLFVVTHQAYELWFGLLLFELGRVRDLLGQPHVRPPGRRVPETDIPLIAELLGRVNEVLRLLTDQFRVIETMPSTHFLAFREALGSASGFQSVQFRELEVLSGLKDADRVAPLGDELMASLEPWERESLQRRRREMTVRQALFDWLARTPVEEAFPGFEEAFRAAFDRYLGQQCAVQEANPALGASARKAAAARIRSMGEALRGYLHDPDPAAARAHAAFLFIASYREEPLLRWPYALLESMVEFEEGFRLYRYRHARMVERMIGLRVGTGGSTGVEYLDQTALRHRVFGALLEARNFLLRPDLLPPLPHPQVLGFRRRE